MSSADLVREICDPLYVRSLDTQSVMLSRAPPVSPLGASVCLLGSCSFVALTQVVARARKSGNVKPRMWLNRGSWTVWQTAKRYPGTRAIETASLLRWHLTPACELACQD
jgi:hypothetical protein